MLRSSEFWVAIVTALGQAGAIFGLWSQEHFNAILFPALVYIIGRITSKIAKVV